MPRTGLLLFHKRSVSMKTLFINACVRENSRTRELAKRLLCRLGEYEEINMEEHGLLPLNAERLRRRDELSAAKDFSAPEFYEARRFAEADRIVIAAPYWDLMFPSLLKIYLENVTVCGVTFYYTEDGIPKGLCRATELYYVSTAGGSIFKNFGFDYVSALARDFYGIAKTKFISAEGLDIRGADVEKIMKEAEDKIDAIEL